MNKNKKQDWYWTTSDNNNVEAQNGQVHFKSEEDSHFNEFPLNSNLHAYDEAYFNYNKNENFMLEEEDVEANLNGYNNYYINDDGGYQEVEYNDESIPSSSSSTKKRTKPGPKSTIVRRGRKPSKNTTNTTLTETPSSSSTSSTSSSKNKSKVFDCPFCSHVSSKQVALESHLKSHIEGKCHAYTCSLCPAATKKQRKVFWPTIHEWLCHIKKCHLKESTVKVGRPKKLRKEYTPIYKPLLKKKATTTNRSQKKDMTQKEEEEDDESDRRSKRLKQKPRIKFNLLAKGKLKLSSIKEKTDISSSSSTSTQNSTQELKIQSSQKLNITKKEKVVSPQKLVFKCREKDCHVNFSTFASRKKHEEIDHVKVHCPMPDCLSIFNIISALRDHMLHEHDIELPPEFESEIQEEEEKQSQRQRLPTPTISEIKTTTTTTTTNNNNINSKPYPINSHYTCEYCGSEYRAKHFYDKHLETHTLHHRVKEIPQRGPSSSLSVNGNAQSTIIQSRNKSGRNPQNYIVIVTPMTSEK